MLQANAGLATEQAAGSAPQPLDLVHLARQTLGDQALSREVLALFADQARSFKAEVAHASIPERLRLAHTLKGSARGIGAFPLAAGVALLEQRPGDEGVLSMLASLVDEVCAFIAAR